MFDAESIKGREQSSKELLRNAFDALICTSEKLDFQKKSYELFGFNIAVFHPCTKEPVLSFSTLHRTLNTEIIVLRLIFGILQPS